MKVDAYEMIRQRVVEQLENGEIPWVRAFHVKDQGFAYSHQSGCAYSLLNQFLLGDSGEYWTFNQAKAEGYNIRKGAKARYVVFWKVLEKKREESPDDIDTIPFLRKYCVFHESDIEGLPQKPNSIILERETRNAERNDEAEAIVDGYFRRNQDIRLVVHIDESPRFVPSSNVVYVPEKCQFDTLDEYYSALFHEMVHSTASKVDRKHNYAKLNDRAREELVAEIGSAFLCGNCGITESVIKNQAAYCRSWLKALGDDIKMLVWAASRAERAAKYILNEENNEENDKQGE